MIFEALNEETNFEGEGSLKKAYETLTRVNQLFIDTVRKTGGNNAKRLLIVTGYATDISKTMRSEYELPTDSVPHRLLISVHYYTPWNFAGMTKDESWGRMQLTWGSAADIEQLNYLFDVMQGFCKRNDLPAFIGEFGVTDKRETASRVRWMSAVREAALSRRDGSRALGHGRRHLAQAAVCAERRAERSASLALQQALEGIAQLDEVRGLGQDVVHVRQRIVLRAHAISLAGEHDHRCSRPHLIHHGRHLAPIDDGHDEVGDDGRKWRAGLVGRFERVDCALAVVGGHHMVTIRFELGAQ